MKQWFLDGTHGVDSLQLQEVPIPEPSEYEVLVKFHAASLNFRDVMIANVSSQDSPNTLDWIYRESKLSNIAIQGQYYIKTKDGVIPGLVL